MTDKFIPFNPETAKNGDIVYTSNNKKVTYVGPDPTVKDVSVIKHTVGYGWDYNVNLTVKAPKKAVWVNVYKVMGVYETYVHNSEDIAAQTAKWDSGCKQHIGTYQLEIDDVA